MLQCYLIFLPESFWTQLRKRLWPCRTHFGGRYVIFHYYTIYKLYYSIKIPFCADHGSRCAFKSTPRKTLTLRQSDTMLIILGACRTKTQESQGGWKTCLEMRSTPFHGVRIWRLHCTSEAKSNSEKGWGFDVVVVVVLFILFFLSRRGWKFQAGQRMRATFCNSFACDSAR